MTLAGANRLFDSVSSTDALDLFPGGQADYARVAHVVGLDTSALARVGNVSQRSVRLDKRIPKDLAARLDEIADICNQVAEYFDGDVAKTVLWFKVPNPMLGNISPRDMIRYGRYKRLRKFVVESREANRRSKEQKTARQTEVAG